MLRLVKSRESSAFPTMVAVRRLETPIETDLPGFARICQDSTVVFGKSLSALSGQSLRSLRLTWCFLRFSGSLQWLSFCVQNLNPLNPWFPLVSHQEFGVAFCKTLARKLVNILWPRANWKVRVLSLRSFCLATWLCLKIDYPQI